MGYVQGEGRTQGTHPRFLLRGLWGAQTEISLALDTYKRKRMLNILGGRKLHAALQDT
jgi:hypothetical protein